jgi:hypothetical protein
VSRTESSIDNVSQVVTSGFVHSEPPHSALECRFQLGQNCTSSHDNTQRQMLHLRDKYLSWVSIFVIMGCISVVCPNAYDMPATAPTMLSIWDPMIHILIQVLNIASMDFIAKWDWQIQCAGSVITLYAGFSCTPALRSLASTTCGYGTNKWAFAVLSN